MRKAVDASKLPMIQFGHHDPLWWAMLLLIAIEGTMLALLAVAHIYVADRTTPFPPTHIDRSASIAMTVEVALWLASIYPMRRSSQAAIAGDIPGMRRWLVTTTLLGLACVAIRIEVFHLLPFRWDQHAYGSVVWTFLALQWLHGLTSVGEGVLYIILLFRGPFEDKHRVDVEVTSPLWYFTVAGSLLIWGLIFAQFLFTGGR